MAYTLNSSKSFVHFGDMSATEYAYDDREKSGTVENAILYGWAINFKSLRLLMDSN